MASLTAAEVLATALALPREERAQLARELIASLDTGEDVDSAEAWVTEMERRASDVRASAVVLEDWPACRARLRERRRGPGGPD